MCKKEIAILGGVATLLLAGCQAPVLAPGAERVVITKLPADVVGCTAVGNVDSSHIGNINDPFTDYSRAQVKNQAIGLNGNVVLQTGPSAGVIYRCKSVPASRDR
jgi:hypothetical protein